MAGVCIISVAVLVTLMLFIENCFIWDLMKMRQEFQVFRFRQINFMFTILTALTVSVASDGGLDFTPCWLFR